MTIGTSYISAAIKSGNRSHFSRVRSDLFYDKPVGGDTVTEQAMFFFCQRHMLQYRSMPTELVLSAAGMPYIETDQAPDYYLNELKKRAVFNAFKDFQKGITPVVSQNFDLDKAYEFINAFSNQVSSINTIDKSRSVVDLGRDIENQVAARKNGAVEIFVPFGWPTLDLVTGGATGGDLIYGVARPGVGKSNTMVYQSHHAWKAGFKPALFSNEMTDLQIARRLYGLEGGFNPDNLRRGIPTTETEAYLRTAVRTFESGIPFHIISGEVRQTIDSVSTIIDELQPDVVYIDAAYLLKLNGPSKQAWEKIAIIGEQLKHIAITRNIPIFQTVQFNREAAKTKKFSLDTIAGSDTIGQIGSVIFAIENGPDQYSTTRRHINLLKNREGELCEFDINYRFDPPDFSEVNALAGTNIEDDILL